jgi:O-antigen biosynthesis protein
LGYDAVAEPDVSSSGLLTETITDSSPSEGGAADYGAPYYAHYAGGAYEHSEPWLSFFAGVADRIVQDFAPRTVLDAGCAIGLLVEALRDRGVEAYGLDISEFAISKVRDDIKPYCWVGSVLDAFPRRYDLICCIEVLEHLEQPDAEKAALNIASHTDEVLFTSTPMHFREETHINIHPPEYWTELFARQGLFRDVEYDPSYLAIWGARFRRTREPVHRLVAEYDRVLARLRYELSERHALVLEQMRELNELRSRAAVWDERARQDRELSELQSVLVSMEKRQRELLTELKWYQEGASPRLARRLNRAAAAAAPQGTLRRAALRRSLRTLRRLQDEGPAGLLQQISRKKAPGLAGEGSLDEQYRTWLEQHVPDERRLNSLRAQWVHWTDAPLVSLLLPVYNPAPQWVEGAIASVQAQTYGRWELCIADDASDDPAIGRLLDRFAATDHRIRVAHRHANGGIAAASNTCLELASGELVGFIDHDDVLHPHALHAIVDHFRRNPDTDLAYSDQDMLRASGERANPVFKPNWSPDLLLSWNYLSHLTVIRRRLIDEVGGFRSEYDGSQDHDLFLRCTEKARAVGHVPDVLYSWHAVEGSVAASSHAKPTAFERGKRAVEAALQRRGTPGRVELGESPGFYNVRYQIQGEPRVGIVIPTRNRTDLLDACIESISTVSTYRNWTITIVDNDSDDPDALAYFAASPHRVVRQPGPFHYAGIINAAAAATDCEHLLLLNNDVLVLTPDWIEALLEHTQRAEIGAAGCRLTYPDGRSQHEGIVLGPGHMPANVGLGVPVVCNVAAVTAACMMVRHEVFDEVSGFDEQIRIAWGDVDFCLRLRQRGYRIVYTPFAQLSHEESMSRGRLSPLEDERRFNERWGPPDQLTDPYVNPNLLWPNPIRLRV